MPSGLPEVIQPVGADASKYISEYQAALKVTKELSEANKDLMRSVSDAQNVIKSAGGASAVGNANDIAKVNQAIREQLQLLGSHSKAISDVTAGSVALARAQADAAKVVRDTGSAARDTAAALGDLAASHEKVTAASTDGGTAVRSHAEDLAALKSAASEATAAIDDASRSISVLTARASGAGRATTSILGPELATAMAGSGFFGGGGSSGGGGGGGGGGFFGGLVGGLAGGGAFDFGGALRQYDATATFLKRWYSFAHYAVMGANEILATVGPAAVAGMAGAYVGLEGGQTAFDRIKAINAVGQSLGSGSPGATPGQLLGLGDSLQKAQTAADPQVWELLGAAINSVRAASDNASGGLGNFWQLGTNTIHMVDEFAASVTQAFQGGAGNQLQALVSGGTGDLKQFGDVLGNVGTTFLHMAPALPGVGGDYLSILQGATRALSVTTGAIPTTALGMILAGEAGGRLGGPIVGGTARLLGKIPGLGSVARAATADDIAAGTIGLESGLPVATLGETIGGTGVAGALGSLSLPTIAALAAGAYTISKIATAQTPGQQRISGLQSQINQSNFTQGLNSLMQNMFETAGQTAGPQSVSGVREFGRGLATEFAHGNLMLGVKEQLNSLFGGSTATTAGSNTAAVQQWAAQFKGVQTTAQDIAKTFGVDLPTAFALADQAGLQVGDSLDKKTGELNAKSKTMIQNTITGYQAMNASAGVMYKNVGAVQVAQGLAGTQLATVNSAWDQLIQNAAGGTNAATGFAGSVGAVKAAASPQAIAKALMGFTSPASQSAWAAFSSNSSSTPGLIQQANTMMDWLRTAQTSGVLNQGQVSAAGMYEARQLLPYAKQSPAALAQLGILSQEAGGPAYDSSKSQAQNYAAISSAIDKAAASGKNFNKIMTAGTIGMADVSKQAQTFGASMKSDVYDAMEKGSVNAGKITKDMQAFISGVSSGNLGGVKNLAQDFAAAKASAGDISTILGNVLSGKGLNTSQIKSIVNSVQSAVASINAKIKVTADTSQVKTLQSMINALHGKNINVAVYANAHPVQTLQAALGGLTNKTVTVTTNMVTNYINTVHTQLGVPTSVAAGVSPSYLLSHGHYGGLVTAKGIARLQTGGMVPGSGSGDIIPAMLEPGEAIIPRYLVPLIAPILAAHRVPGFGGVPQSSASHFAAGGLVPGMSGNVGKDIAYSLIDGITTALKQSGAQKIADALVNKIGQEVQYAKQTASSVTSGLNLGGMDLTQGSVLQQMQNYAASSAAFGKDLGTLRKDHLAKGLISQLVAAGPVQGDLLAQSILGTGVGGVNKVWGQIGHSANIIGAQAAMAQYGGTLAPNLKSGTVTQNNVTISINAGGGATLSLTDAQVKALVAKIQAELLKQAKRNPRTGLQLSGKGA